MVNRINREEVKTRLSNGPVTIIFLKKDGTERRLVGSLAPEYVQEWRPTSNREKNPEAQSVIDLEIMSETPMVNPWRSFRWDSVIGVDGVFVNGL